MFDIAVCNDNISELEYLDYLLDTYCLEHPWPVVSVRRFQSLYDLVDCIRAGRTFSLYILGHRSELWMNHLSPEAVLRREEPRGEIIAITSGRATALTPTAGDPLRLTAVLAKQQVQDVYLYPVLHRLIEAHQEKDSPVQPCFVVPISAPQRKQSLPYANISYVCYEDHIITCRLASGAPVISPKLRRPFYQIIRPLLMEPRFTQVSAAAVVNLDFVDRITQKPPRVWMANGEGVKAAGEAVDGILEEYGKYISQPGKKRVKPIAGDFSKEI